MQNKRLLMSSDLSPSLPNISLLIYVFGAFGEAAVFVELVGRSVKATIGEGRFLWWLLYVGV